MSDANKIAARLQELTSFIEDARNKLSNGEIIKIAHLDGEIAQICNQTLSLPPKEAVQVQPIMANMISRLEELGLALKDFQNNLKSKNGLQ